jgi:TonB family protein
MTPVRGYTLAFPSGSRPARRDEGLHMLEVDSAAIAKIGKTPADWTRYEIRFDADHVTVIVDGNRVVDRQEPGIAGGWFGVRAEVGSVALRNLDIGPWTQDVQVGARFVEISATFNTKGVEFGPWFRRFFARVKEHAFVPDAPASGHVAVTFSVRTDGSIADLTIASPSPIEDFNRAAHDVVVASNPFQPLPREYPEDQAFFTLTFYYNERPPR